MVDRTKEIIAVFIDYADLHDSIIDRIAQPDQAHTRVVELVRSLLNKHYSDSASGATLFAYADFSQFAAQAGEVEQLLYTNGITPRFVSCLQQATAAEVQLAAEAVDLLHRTPGVSTLAIVSGGRTYMPLVQLIRAYGRNARVVLFDAKLAAEQQPALANIIIEAGDYLNEHRRRVAPAPVNIQRAPEPVNGNGHNPLPPATDEPLTYDDVTDPVSLDALELIIDCFGQYEEIYLTPLLRKMSENMSVDDYDPKTIIAELEDAGAVWLEKRHGVPYDYTVLILDDQHPDVQRLRREGTGRFRQSAYGSYSETGQR